jgi:hypothetical protein
VIANKYAFPYETALFYYTFTILSQNDALRLAPGTNMALTTWTVASAQDFMKSISQMSSTQISQMFPGMAANAAIDETTFMTQIQNYISNNNIGVPKANLGKAYTGGARNWNTIMGRITTDLAILFPDANFEPSVVKSLVAGITTQRTTDIAQTFTRNLASSDPATKAYAKAIGAHLTINLTVIAPSDGSLTILDAWNNAMSDFKKTGLTAPTRAVVDLPHMSVVHTLTEFTNSLLAAHPNC